VQEDDSMVVEEATRKRGKTKLIWTEAITDNTLVVNRGDDPNWI